MNIRTFNSSDRANGILLGLAAGDRNGGPLRMAVRLSESLKDQSGFVPEDVGTRYLSWWKEGAFDTGPTSARVLQLVASGIPFSEAALQVHKQFDRLTAGCNPAHRSAPLAMSVALKDHQLHAAAFSEAKLTHAHALAGDVAAAAVMLCRFLIRGVDWQAALIMAQKNRQEETVSALSKANKGDLLRDGFAPHALGAAVYFLNKATSFRNALEDSIAFAGPENYCPVLVGSIGGARWGESQISEDLLIHYPDDLLARIRSVASALADAWKSSTSL